MVRMMLSAMGSRSARLTCAAVRAMCASRSTTRPCIICATARCAAARPRWASIRLYTSKSAIEGTTKRATASMGGAKAAAFGPSAKYSSQADESTTFAGLDAVSVPLDGGVDAAGEAAR